MSEQEERLVAKVYVPLSLKHISEFADALENAVGEKLYFRGDDDCVFNVVSLGEPHVAKEDEDDT